MGYNVASRIIPGALSVYKTLSNVTLILPSCNIIITKRGRKGTHNELAAMHHPGYTISPSQDVSTSKQPPPPSLLAFNSALRIIEQPLSEEDDSCVAPRRLEDCHILVGNASDRNANVGPPELE